MSSVARTAIDDARRNATGLAISDIILLALATLASKGRVRLDISLESFPQEVEARFVGSPLRPSRSGDRSEMASSYTAAKEQKHAKYLTLQRALTIILRHGVCGGPA